MDRRLERGVKPKLPHTAVFRRTLPVPRLPVSWKTHDYKRHVEVTRQCPMPIAPARFPMELDDNPEAKDM